MCHGCSSFLAVLGIACLPPLVSASVVVNTSLSLTQLQVSPTSGTVQLTLSASAFGSVFDSLGGSNFGFDPGPVTASAQAITTLAGWTGAADSTAFTAGSSSGVDIPGVLGASAGTVPGGNYGDLQGTFEIIDNSGGSNPVNVNFSAKLTGSQDLTTDNFGVLAQSEAVFNLVVGSTNELFLDSPLQIGRNSTVSHPISTTLTNSDTLLTNTPYFFDAQVDAESYGVNVPEPTFVWLAGALCLVFLTGRFRRAR